MTDLTPIDQLPADPKTGLTLPLSKSLGSQDLARHKAMVAVELEVMAKKFDRFGWERDRNTPVHDRLVMDWMAALQDYPLNEVQDACRKWVEAQPRKMPNEGDIKGLILSARQRKVSAQRPVIRQEAPREAPVSKEAAAEILAAAGFSVKKGPFDA